jgi:hypothetical protein
MLDECAESIENATPEEIAAEMEADGEDVSAIAAQTKQALLDGVAKFQRGSQGVDIPEDPEWWIWQDEGSHDCCEVVERAAYQRLKAVCETAERALRDAETRTQELELELTDYVEDYRGRGDGLREPKVYYRRFERALSHPTQATTRPASTGEPQ